MFKKTLLITVLCLLPFSAQAKCDLSVKNIRTLSQRYLNAVYKQAPMGLKKPKLIVSNKKVNDFYAEELNGVITVYPKAFTDQHCGKNVDELTPFVGEVISHEYTHYLDEKLHISKKLGKSSMSEYTANLGENVFDALIWNTGYTTKELTETDVNKYLKFMKIIKAI